MSEINCYNFECGLRSCASVTVTHLDKLGQRSLSNSLFIICGMPFLDVLTQATYYDHFTWWIGDGRDVHCELDHIQ